MTCSAYRLRDYNVADGLWYGNTDLGVSGFYSIYVQTSTITQTAAPPRGVNGQGRRLACGQQVVFLICTRGADGAAVFAYDLGPGPNGTCDPFTQPFP